MDADRAALQARLAALDGRDDHGAAGMRLRLVRALARRAQDLQGEARAQLERRLAGLLDTLPPVAGDAGPDHAGSGAAGDPPAHAGRAALRTLLDRIDSERQAVGAGAPGNGFPALPLLDEFRRRWDGLRAESQLRQSLAPADEEAGPLNSVVLVRRAIALMRDSAPGYLRHFLAYADALTGLEQLRASARAPAGEAAAPAANKRKSPRGTPRRRG
ncbi:DUF2894 domain-containing protein [Xanthomonas massiliensis]|uniref:DUF2894 domain-containing protein n=1 Tax=Xanthomonas massiliensis TaxID=1720302 RepID=UPI0008261870|nr:DUF2894 domain-containing protein [Xanthomonas massiliensis]